MGGLCQLDAHLGVGHRRVIDKGEVAVCQTLIESQLSFCIGHVFCSELDFLEFLFLVIDVVIAMSQGGIQPLVQGIVVCQCWQG